MATPEKSNHLCLVYYFTIHLIKFVPPLSRDYGRQRAPIKMFQKRGIKKVKTLLANSDGLKGSI